MNHHYNYKFEFDNGFKIYSNTAKGLADKYFANYDKWIMCFIELLNSTKTLSDTKWWTIMYLENFVFGIKNIIRLEKV